MADAGEHRWRRVAGLALTGVAIEAALFVLARRAPAMAGLVRPLYAAVAAVLVYTLWHTAHARRGRDRRREDRRDPTTSERG
ncbi:MAG: hypothetical protein ACREPM_07705 [Gemmatimonadaceae bacterium]